MIGAAMHLAVAAFTPWFVERGVNVEIARTKDQIPWIRGTFELPVPPEQVLTVVSDFGRYKEIFAPALERATVLEKGQDSVRLHMVWPYPAPLRDRDAVVVYTLERLEDGVTLLKWKDEARPGDPKKGVRIKHVEGETRIEPASGGTRVTYTYVGDLGGKFPASVNERVWRGEPIGYMQALRRAVGLPLLKKE
ncbi:MAG TPA: SRPBCC family protein [Thermoanaerobaculia bacterium]|nr:SRPBCC family protein [Thermoanaerobaculia bacterium]